MDRLSKEKINKLLYKRLELVSDYAAQVALSISSKMIVAGGLSDVSLAEAKTVLNSTAQCGLIISDLLFRNNKCVYDDDLKTLGNGSVKRVPDFIPKIKLSKKDVDDLFDIHDEIRTVTKAFRRDLFVYHDCAASMPYRSLLEHSTRLMRLHHMLYDLVE